MTNEPETNPANLSMVAPTEMASLVSENLSIPTSIRSFVYMIGMVGFPVLIATFVIMQLSSDIQSVDKRLEELAMQIDERPMSIDRTTDFINYSTSSLAHELENSLLPFIESFDFNFDSKTDASQKINLFSNEVQAIVRPIVRRHQRFASRFPSIGGNLGSYYYLEAPAEDQTEGDTEAYLGAIAKKDFSESLDAVLQNLIVNYGTESFLVTLGQDSLSNSSGTDPLLQFMEDLMSSEDEDDLFNSDVSPMALPVTEIEYPDSNVMIDKILMKRLTTSVINSATIGLRDQMILNVRINSAEKVQ